MKSKIILLSLVYLSLLSCSEPYNEWDERIDLRLFPRQCKFMWADNIRVNQGVALSSLKGNSTVKLSEYSLGFSTCNVDIVDIPSLDYRNMFRSEEYSPLDNSPYMYLTRSSKPMTDYPDPLIEDRLRQYKMSRSAIGVRSSQLLALLQTIDYRTTHITKLKITCSHSILGVNAGESLNDFFIIFGYPMDHDFIISSNRQIITEKIRKISIARYLSYSPLAPAAIYLSFKEGLSITAPKEVKFTVELELEGENIIKATTKPITLTP